MTIYNVCKLLTCELWTISFSFYEILKKNYLIKKFIIFKYLIHDLSYPRSIYQYPFIISIYQYPRTFLIPSEKDPFSNVMH